MPRVQAKKRGPHRRTLERQLEHARALLATPRAGERIANLEREVAELKAENRRLKRRLGLLSRTEIGEGQ
jgi:hypothetical protein